MRNVQLSDNKPTSSYALQKVHRKDGDCSTSIGDDLTRIRSLGYAFRMTAELSIHLRLRYATLENDSTY